MEKELSMFSLSVLVVFSSALLIYARDPGWKGQKSFPSSHCSDVFLWRETRIEKQRTLTRLDTSVCSIYSLSLFCCIATFSINICRERDSISSS